MEQNVRVFCHNQDTRTDEPLTLETPDCCREMRQCGMGRFLNKRTFRLFKPKPAKLNASDRDMRGTSAVIDELVMAAYVEGEQWALEAVRAWRQDVADRRHRSSLKRLQTSVPKRTRAEGSPA
jgi:hypothetical protein